MKNDTVAGQLVVTLERERCLSRPDTELAHRTMVVRAGTLVLTLSSRLSLRANVDNVYVMASDVVGWFELYIKGNNRYLSDLRIVWSPAGDT